MAAHDAGNISVLQTLAIQQPVIVAAPLAIPLWLIRGWPTAGLSTLGASATAIVHALCDQLRIR